jgi:hypothetical protein
MKGACSFTKKDARLEPVADSDIEIIDLAKRPDIVKPTQGQVTIDFPAKSRPLGSRSGGTDLSEVVASIRGLVEVGRGIQEELWGQRLAAEEQVNELRKHREAMTESTEALCDIGAVLLNWLDPKDTESGSKGGEDKEEESGQEPESKKEPEKELAAEVEETMDTSQ